MAEMTEDVFKNLECLKLGYGIYPAVAFDELELGRLIDDTTGGGLAPVIKACCLRLICDEELALSEVGRSFISYPYKVLLEPISSLEELSNESVSRVLQLLGRLDLESLYSRCAAQALTCLQQHNGSEPQSEAGGIHFFSSGCVDLEQISPSFKLASSRVFNFNAMLDGRSFIPTTISFAELSAEELEEIESCQGRKASKFVSAMRASALTALLQRSSSDDNAGLKLELEKALCTAEVLAAAEKAGIEVVPRKVGQAALVQRPGGWVLWEMLENRMHACAAQFLKTEDSCRAVCFILALSLLLWYYLGARVGAACEKLGIKSLDLGRQMTLTRKNFRFYVKKTDPNLFVLTDRQLTKPVNITPTLAAVTKELGPCYSRYLSAETYDGRALSVNF